MHGQTTRTSLRTKYFISAVSVNRKPTGLSFLLLFFFIYIKYYGSGKGVLQNRMCGMIFIVLNYVIFMNKKETGKI